MPELPEVETIRRFLAKDLIGRRILDVEVRKAKIFQGNPKDVIGKTIVGVERKGKILIVKLSDGARESLRAQRVTEGTEVVMLVHFKLTGQMVWAPNKNSKFKIQNSKFVVLGHPIPFAGSELPAKTTHVIFELTKGKLFYNDLRQFGWIKIIQRSKIKNQKEIAKLGPEPFTREFTEEYLEKIFSKTSKPIKLVLLDQEKIAGIGNIYANDALFEAGIMPTRPAKSLRKEEIEILRYSILRVLEDGLKYGGSSAKDEAYIKPDGESGSYQNHFRVYQRTGEECRRCGGIVKRINLGGRGTFYCEGCQE